VPGLTATPFRKDGHHPIVLMQSGRIRDISVSVREQAAVPSDRDHRHRRIEEALGAFEAKVSVPAPALSQLRSPEKRQRALQRHHLEQITGADLTKLPGLVPPQLAPIEHDGLGGSEKRLGGPCPLGRPQVHRNRDSRGSERRSSCPARVTSSSASIPARTSSRPRSIIRSQASSSFSFQWRLLRDFGMLLSDRVVSRAAAHR
jgi:hypothetical protein